MLGGRGEGIMTVVLILLSFGKHCPENLQEPRERWRRRKKEH